MPAEKLKGSDLQTLWRMIVDSFNQDEIKRILRFSTDLRLDKTVRPQEFEGVVFDLMERLEDDGNLHLFLRGIHDDRPALTDLRNAIATICPEALKTSAGVAVDAKRAAVGVEVIAEQLSDPQVRSLVVPHRDELKRLMDGIEVLANYKRLHDYLQTIQLTHQLQMVADMQRLRGDEIAGTTLEAHLFDLDNIYDEALKAAKCLPDAAAVRADEMRWISKLRSTIDQIRRAVDNLDDREGGRALRSLRLLIRPESYRINGRLSAVADELPLERLLSTIADVVQASAQAGVTAVELQDGLQSLQKMLPELKGKVAEHNKWQDIEREFILTDEFTDQGTPDSIQDFTDAWPSMRRSVADLAQLDAAASWAQKTQNWAGNVDANLAANTDKARAAFVAFRRTVQFHFFEVDRALRTQCEAILAIRVPLKSLLSEV